MLAAGDLAVGGQAVMSAIVNAASQLKFVLPERRYVTVGGSVFDCAQVTVSVMSSATGVVAGEGAQTLVGPCDPTWSVTYEAAIVLCAVEAVTGPRGETPPTPAAIESDTANMSMGYAILTNAIGDLAAGASGPIRASVMFGQPQGGLIAVVANLTVNLWL